MAFDLTREHIRGWCDEKTFASAESALKAGFIVYAAWKPPYAEGTVERGGKQFTVRFRLLSNGLVDSDCPCYLNRDHGQICSHVVALALKLLPPLAAPAPIRRTLTQNQILKWCGKPVFDEAEKLLKRGSVLRAEYRHPVVEGEIAKDFGAMKVRFKILSDGLIDSECPCYQNREQGIVCAHAMAVAIQVMRRQTDPLKIRRHQEEQRRIERLSAIDDSLYLQRAPGGTPAALGLVFPADLPARFAAGNIALTVMILIEGKAHAPEEISPKRVLAFSRADENLLAVLEDIGGGPVRTCTDCSPVDFISVLQCAMSTCAVTPGGEPFTVHAEAVESRLELSIDPESHALVVAVKMPLPGETAILAAMNRGFALCGNEAWPLRKVLPLPYHPLYQDPIRVPGNGVIRFLRNELPLLEKLLPLNLEGLTPDQFLTTPGEPAFVLTLQGSAASVAAKLEALYNGEAFPACGPDTTGGFSYPDPDDPYRFFVRNAPAEQKALARLVKHGFGGEHGGALKPLVGNREVLNLLGSGITTFRRIGWKVTVTGSLGKLFEEAEVIVPVVHVDSNADGFEIAYTYESPQNVADVTPAEIQRAIQCGEAFVHKGDRTVLLDIAAIESMRDVFADTPSTPGRRPGSFHLAAIHAPFVQAALEAIEGIDIEEAPDWRARAAARNRNARLSPVPLGPLETTLRPYQKEGVYWLRFLEEGGFGGILADEMGLGKTLQTLTWLQLQRTRETARRRPALIVCPTSLVENWNREAEKFTPRLKRLVLSGGNRGDLFGEIDSADLVITSYALIRRDIESYLDRTFSVIVLDEAQNIKNRSTQNAVAVKQLRADTRLVLTGTPIENSIADLWSIMDFLMPSYLGIYDTFKLHYEDPILNAAPDAEAAQAKLRRKLHPFLLRRLKRDVARDLPEKIQKISYCTLTPDQQRVYDDVLAKTRGKMGSLVKEKGFNAARMEILALLMQLRQICCHLHLIKDRTPNPKEAPSAKLDHFLEILDEAIQGGHRILVFSQFTTMLKIIRAELEARRLECCYLDGSTQNRLEQCARFNQTPSIPVFLISLKAGGTGLNLTGADMVIHFDPWWNPAAEDQATDRAHRIGQKKTVYALKLIAENTIEEKVLQMQQRKQALIDATVGSADAAVAQSLTWDDVRQIVGL